MKLIFMHEVMHFMQQQPQWFCANVKEEVPYDAVFLFAPREIVSVH